MNSLTIPLSEENIFANIAFLREQNQNSIDIYKKILAILPHNYDSIKSNFLPLFIYDMVTHKINVQEFSATINYIYKDSVDQQYEKLIGHTFYRFFNLKDSDFSYKDFTHESTPENMNMWDKLLFLFFASNEDKIILRPDNLPYLKVMLNNLNTYNINQLYEGCFNMLHYYFKDNYAELIPIIKIANCNSAYKKFSPPDHFDFITHVIKSMDQNSSNISDISKNIIYTTLKQHYSDFESYFSEQLISFNQYENRFIIGYGLADYIDIISGEKFVDLFDKTYKKALGISHEKDNVCSYKAKNHYDMASKININLNVLSKYQEIPLFLDKINIEQSFYYNFIHIKLLECAIDHGVQIACGQETKNYLLKTLLELEKDPYYYKALIDHKKIFQYFQYIELQEKTAMKHDTSKKNKL